MGDDDTSVDEDGDEAGPGGCGDDAGAAEPQTLCLEPGQEHELTLPHRASLEEDLRDWPRYATAFKGRDDKYRPALILQGPGGTWNHQDLTVARLNNYFDTTRPRSTRRQHPHRPHIWNAHTWGPYVTCRVPVGTIVHRPDQPHEPYQLEWYPPGDPRAKFWTFRIYNVTVEKPGQERHYPNPQWLPFLERTVMRIPYEHLRATRFRGIYLGFTVGAPFAPQQLPRPGVVSTGGSNTDVTSPTADTIGSERGVLSIVSITYSALNRPWATHGANPGPMIENLRRGATLAGPALPAAGDEDRPLEGTDEVDLIQRGERAFLSAFFADRTSRSEAAPIPRDGEAIDGARRIDRIESWFADPLMVQGTVLHEFGHLHDQVDRGPPPDGAGARRRGDDDRSGLVAYPDEGAGSPADPAVPYGPEEREQARAHWQALSTSARRAGNDGTPAREFDVYRGPTECNYHGSTNSATEGYAEAYRRLFSGEFLNPRGPQLTDNQLSIMRRWRQNGMPSLRSVRRAAIAMARYMSQDDRFDKHVIANPSPDPWDPPRDRA